MFRNHKDFVALKYTIEECSSFVSGYRPENITKDEPTNPSSRWSTSATSLDQSITLKLSQPAVVTTITFGKYCKVHVCNVKELRVFCNNTETLRCTLRNDTEKETFNVKYTYENTYLLSDRIKICPLSSWGMNFNYSMWFVELRGLCELEDVLMYNVNFMNGMAYKLVVKYLEGVDWSGVDLKDGKVSSGCLIKSSDDGKINDGLNEKILLKEQTAEKPNEIQNLDEKNNSTTHRFINKKEKSKKKILKESKRNNKLNKDKRNIKNNLRDNSKDNLMDNSKDSSKDDSKDISKDSECVENKEEISLMPQQEIKKVIKLLEKKNKMKVEHEQVTEVKKLVKERRYEELEVLIEKMGEEGVYNNYIECTPYRAEWREIEKSGEWPSERGGHQLVKRGDKLLLYGGWDGERELGDFWEFNPKNEKWNVLSADNGPGRRSCHKMVVVDNILYLFGRYIPMEYQRQSDWLEREIFCYDGHWMSKRFANGPTNLFDHQIVGFLKKEGGGPENNKINEGHTDNKKINEGRTDNKKINEGRTDNKKINEGRTDNKTGIDNKYGVNGSEYTDSMNTAKSSVINPNPKNTATYPMFYIFGGRAQNDQQQYSGLYCLDNDKMNLLRSQTLQPHNTPELRGRVGHVMLFIPPGHFKKSEDPVVKFRDLDELNNTLLIIGGQRAKEAFREIVFYGIDEDTVYKNVNFPVMTEGKIVQRAVLRGHEIVVYFSYSKEKEKLDSTALFVYNLKLDRWFPVLGEGGPSARSAHQIVDFKEEVANKDSKGQTVSTANYEFNNVVNRNCEIIHLENAYSGNKNYKDSIYIYGGNLGSNSKRIGDLWQLNLQKKGTKEIINDLKFIVRKHKFLKIENKIEALTYLKSDVSVVVDHIKDAEKYKDLCCSKLKNYKSCDAEFEKEILDFLPVWMKAPAESVEELCK